jgi:maltose alpha-D-glucosyltransferase / alpha-amylase
VIQDLWFKNTIIYYLDIETFLDANNDGVGDFEGLMRRLDYLAALGVDSIWLSPFQPSPNLDNGYDISDYYGVDPRYGSSGDFVEFMNAANQRGIKVLIDLVVNHTSDQHRWFQEARKSQDSPYRDWYIWAKEKPSYEEPKTVFPGVVESTWSYDEEAEAFYFHRFYPFQPDLNFTNPEVRTEIWRIMGYWLQLNVHGFRVDAVPFLIETEIEEEKFHRRFECLYEMRRFLQWRRGDAIFLGEVNVAPEDAQGYFAEGYKGIHMLFNFYVNQYIFHALATGDTGNLKEAINASKPFSPMVQWANFLRNHDELNLGHLSEQERADVFAEFGPEKGMQLYGRGLRRRLAPMLGERRRLELAYSLLFSLPGTPVLYYGDEIGMGEDLSLTQRNSVRTPMQWANEPQAAFSQADELVRPVIDEGPYSFEHVNVEDQRRDPDSLLNWMTRMIALRKQCPEVGWGEWQILEVACPSVLAMRYDWRGVSLVIVHNFSQEAQEIHLDIGLPEHEWLVNLLVEDRLHKGGSGRYRLILDPYGYQWYRVGHLTHSVERQRE